jgi:short-subunit dehydrogenase
MFAEALRHELADTGVSLTTVYPGEIATSLHDHEKDRMPAWYRGGPQAAAPEELAEKIVAAIEADARAVYHPPLVRALGIVHGLNAKAGDAFLRRLRGDSAAPRRG